MNAPLALTFFEGEALRVAEGLVGRGRAAPPDGLAILGDTPRAALVEAVARTFAAACVRFVLERGGARESTVLRHARRMSGRVWDERMNEGFSLAFSEAAYALWWGVVKDVLPVAFKKRTRTRPDEPEVTRDERRMLKGALPQLARTTGDAVLFLLAHEHAGYLRLPRPLEDAVQQALRDASPLARVWAPDDAGAKEPLVRKRVAEAITQHARVLELVDEALAQSWTTRLAQLVLRSADLAELRARAEAFALTLTTLIEVADHERALHLVRPVALFLARVPTEALPETFDVRAHALRVPGVKSMADRDVVLHAVGAIVDVVRRLDDVRARMAAERYGDERYEEAQLVLRILDDTLTPERAAVEAVSRRLSGAVG